MCLSRFTPTCGVSGEVGNEYTSEQLVIRQQLASLLVILLLFATIYFLRSSIIAYTAIERARADSLPCNDVDDYHHRNC